MTKPRIEVEGLQEFLKAVRKAGDKDLLTAVKGANKEAADVVAKAAKPEAPVLTGRLAGSVRATATQKVGQVRAGKASVPYAGVIHFGGYHNIRPTPFLYDALDSRASAVVDAYEERIADLLRKFD